MEKKLLLTTDETGDALGLKHSKICELIASGEIPSVKIGKSRRIPIQSLEAYIQKLIAEQVA